MLHCFTFTFCYLMWVSGRLKINFYSLNTYKTFDKFIGNFRLINKIQSLIVNTCSQWLNLTPKWLLSTAKYFVLFCFSQERPKCKRKWKEWINELSLTKLLESDGMYSYDRVNFILVESARKGHDQSQYAEKDQCVHVLNEN